MAFLSATAVYAETITIIQDSILAPDGTRINDTPPLPGDLPGGRWVNGNSPNVIYANQQIVGNDGAIAVSIASAGDYKKPTKLTISADLNLGEMKGSNDPSDSTAGAVHIIPRGVSLGFFKVPGTLNGDNLISCRRAPYGVTYCDSGKLLLVVASPSDGAAADVLAAVTTYGPDHHPIPLSGTHHLAYSVDTSTGGIYGVKFDGYPIDFGVKTTQFTDANTNIAGSYAGSGTGNSFGQLSNFTVTGVVPDAGSDAAASTRPKKL